MVKKSGKSERSNIPRLGTFKSSLYTKNHRFTFKALIFCPKTSVEFIESLSIKKVQAIKEANVLM
jgi:hypothetical protein